MANELGITAPPDLSVINDYMQAYVGKTENEQLIDNLKSEISRLNAENSQLTEKLATYIESTSATYSAENNIVSAELEKLRYEKNELQNENDTYLMKISELSFENAKLTSQLQQLQSLSKDTKALPEPVQCENTTSNQNTVFAKSNNVSYNKSTIDGYSSWN